MVTESMVKSAGTEEYAALRIRRRREKHGEINTVSQPFCFAFRISLMGLSPIIRQSFGWKWGYLSRTKE